METKIKDSMEEYEMRDPNRLDDFYSELCRMHKLYIPDWRFGQFCSNFFGWLMSTKGIDLFFPEEDKMLDYVKEFLKGPKPGENRSE